MIYNESKKNGSWATMKLSDLGSFSRGVSRHRPRNDEKLFENGQYPLVQTGDVKKANLYITSHTQEYSEFGLSQSKIWDAGTLCITIAANIAETGILSYPMCFPDSVVGFKANPEKTTEEFMYYIFEYIKQAIQNAASGSIQDNINIGVLTDLEFKIPTEAIRNRITNILVGLDCTIISNDRINEALHQMVHDQFMHTFFRKEPNGKLSDLIIEHPKSSIQVGDAKEILGNFPFFTSGDTVLEWPNYLVDERVILLNTGGSADVKFYAGKAAYSTDTWCISAKNSLSDYLYMLLFTIKKELDQKFFLGTGLKHLQKPLLIDRPIYIPTPDEAKEFNRIAIPALSIISSNLRENKIINKLRDWLLPMLMNGQATVQTD